MTTFEDLGLRPEILSAIAQLGYESPMPIQEQVIPFMLENEGDLVALAQTGTGKTAAFGLPLLTKIDTNQKRIQALILSPTRELCIQIANDLKHYAAQMNGVKIVPVYGGENIVSQYKQLDVQPQILVATPGRLLDLQKRGKVRLDSVNYLVLDEADEMLDMGFKDDLEAILQAVPDERRTLLFSATMPKEIANIARQYMHDATEIAIGTRNAGAENVDHLYYMVQAKQRYLALKRIVDMNPDIYAIVFCRTRQEAKEVAEKLMSDGYNADALHGDLSQAQRDTVMGKFRQKILQILVATDVAARGLDVSDLTHVINYNLPDDVEVYTHRSGRTGRAGKRGISISIVHQREQRKIRTIEHIIKKKFERAHIPQGIDICKRQLFHLIERMENVHVNDEQIEPFLPHVFAKLDYLSKEDVIRRFVSLEFNRFLDYYRDAEDLNLPEKPERTKEKRSEKSPKKRSENGDKKGFKRGQRVRMSLNLGFRQNANVRSVLGAINDVTNDRTISIGDIEITQRCTFFDVYADQADQILEAFNRKGGKLKIEIVGKREKKEEKPFRPDKETKRKGKYADKFDDPRAARRYENRRKNQQDERPINPEKPWRRRR